MGYVPILLHPRDKWVFALQNVKGDSGNGPVAPPALGRSLHTAPDWGVGWQRREFLSIASDYTFWGGSLHLLGLRSSSLIMGED